MRVAALNLRPRNWHVKVFIVKRITIVAILLLMASWLFNVGPIAADGTDEEPPFTSGHDPAPDAVDVAIDTNVVLHVKDGSHGVDESTIVMRVDDVVVTPDISGTASDYTLTYDPTSDFGHSQVVEVEVDASDLEGNAMLTASYSFTTVADPPFTSGHDPAPDAVDVAIDTNIVVHLEDSGDGVDDTTIVMRVDDVEVTPAISGTASDYTLTYDPTGDFGHSQVVEVEVDASDLDGNAMLTDSYSFTTVAEPDGVPPFTSGHDPAPDAVDVAIDANIVVHLKDSGDGVDDTSIVMRVDGVVVTPAISGAASDYTLTYDPPSDFGHSQVVELEVDASDLAANAMLTASYSFTTVSEPVGEPPEISNVQISSITATSAVVTWETDEDSDSMASYGTDDSLGTSRSDANLVMAHAIALTGLSPNSMYFVKVQSTDADENTSVDETLYTFTTLEAEQVRRAFVGVVVELSSDAVTLVRQGTGERVSIILPDNYRLKTPGGPRAGTFGNGARVVIQVVLADGEWVARRVLVKPVKHNVPIIGVVVGVHNGVITVMGPEGTSETFNLPGGAFEPSVGDVLTVFTGTSKKPKSVVKAKDVRKRLKKFLDDFSDDEAELTDEEVDKLDEIVERLSEILENHGATQVGLIDKVLKQISNIAKAKVSAAKVSVEEDREQSRFSISRAKDKIEKKKQGRGRGRSHRSSSDHDDDDD